MLIRVPKGDVGLPSREYGLLEILRALSNYDRDSVTAQEWVVTDLEIFTMYTISTDADGEEALSLFFGDMVYRSERIKVENEPKGLLLAVVRGDILLQRCALVRHFHNGFFMRLIEPGTQIEMPNDRRLWNGPPQFQGTNIDLEIRCCEGSHYDIVSWDHIVIAALLEQLPARIVVP